MSSGEKILSSIKADSERNIMEIKEKSKAECDRIISKGQAAAYEIRQKNEIKKAEQTARLTKSGKSRIELEKRNMILKAKREEIDKAVNEVLCYMKELPAKEYFELIYRLAATLGKKSGTVFLCQKDLARVPEGFEKRLAGCGIAAVLSREPDNSIDSGFILKNGDIEDNMSFDSVVAEKREAVEDLINRELFKD
ncbi:MAG: V-type ATP synthase subunit E [Clostridia bacterium]|nr:V-type ATP synthase subunit E [Clostridia bacterium]